MSRSKARAKTRSVRRELLAVTAAATAVITTAGMTVPASAQTPHTATPAAPAANAGAHPAAPTNTHTHAVPQPAIAGAPSNPHPDRDLHLTISRQGDGKPRAATAPTPKATPNTSPNSSPSVSPNTATTPDVPTNLYADNTSSYTPTLYANVSSSAGGSVTAYMTVRDSRGSVVATGKQSASSGSQVSTKEVAGLLRVGDSYTFSAHACQNNVCSAESATQPLILDPLLGAGQRKEFNTLSKKIDDQITAAVNVGSGNLQLSQQHLALSGLTQNLSVGHVYNSLAWATGSTNHGALDAGQGWRESTGQSIRLLYVHGGGVDLFDGTGHVDEFTGNDNHTVGQAYTSPPGIDATLQQTSGGFTLTYHQSGEVLTFDSSGVLTSDADRNNNKVTFAYPNGDTGHMASLTGTRGADKTVTYTYGGPAGQRSAITQSGNGASRNASQTFDSNGDLTSVTDVTGGLTQYTYAANHQLTKITDPAGHITTIGYDTRNRVTTLTQDPNGINATTTFTYELGPGGKTRVTDPNGKVTTYTIDYADRVSNVVDANGHTQSGSYTPDAKVGSATSAEGGTTTNTYGANNGESMTQSTDPQGATQSATYPSSTGVARYLPSTSTDSSGNSSTYTYDGPGNLTSSKSASAATASVSYNSNGTPSTSTDPNNSSSGVHTSYNYDANGNLTSIVPPSGNTLRTTTPGYDLFGRLSSQTTGNGVTRTFTLDAADRQTKTSYSDSTAAVSSTFDPDGNQSSRADGTGTTSYTYDALNELTEKQLPGSSQITGVGDLRYGYDPAGNLTSLRDDRGQTSYGYDPANNMVKMSESGGNTDVFAYNRDNQRTDTWGDTEPNPANPPNQFAIHIHSVFNTAKRLQEIITSRNSDDNTLVSDLTYSYARPDNGTATSTRYNETNLLTQVGTAYTYDKDMRLTDANTTDSSNDYHYTYDSDGNATHGPLGDLNYNNANQVTNSPITYDADGNLTTGGTGTLTYNGADQTTTITNNGSPAVNLTYSGTDQTELTTIGTTHLVNGPLGVQSQTTAAGTTYYERDPEGGLVSERGPDGTFYYALDGHNSVIGLVDDQGKVAANYTYDPYGKQTVSGPNQTAANNNPWGYASGYEMPAGLEHFGQRYNLTGTGSWSQQDTVNHLADCTQGNRYSYAADNPINNLDPSGKDTYLSACALGAISGVLVQGIGNASGVSLLAGAALGCAIGVATEYITRQNPELGAILGHYSVFSDVSEGIDKLLE